MDLVLQIVQAGKRFDKHWIFKGISLELQSGNCLAVLGSNGSGKSTFIKLLSGYLKPSEGALQLKVNQQVVTPNQLYSQVALAAPYAELLDDLTLSDLLKAHAQFMPWRNGLKSEDIVELTLLKGNEGKALKAFSSGMKQRLKLGLAILSQRPLLLLDEPTSNLDASGVQWFRKILSQHIDRRIVVIGTNEPARDLVNETQQIRITDFKP